MTQANLVKPTKASFNELNVGPIVGWEFGYAGPPHKQNT